MRAGLFYLLGEFAVSHVTRQDLRALWDNSKEARDSFRRQLGEWGAAQRGGFPDLGFYHEQVWAKKPRGGARYDVEQVDAITESIKFWRLVSNCDQIASARAIRLHRILSRHFIQSGPAKGKAKEEGVSRARYYQLLDEAMFSLWVIHSRLGVDKPARQTYRSQMYRAENCAQG